MDMNMNIDIYEHEYGMIRSEDSFYILFLSSF